MFKLIYIIIYILMNFENEVREAQHLNFVDPDTRDFLIGSELDFDDEQHLLFDGQELFTGLGRQIIIDDVIENYPDLDAIHQFDQYGRPTSVVHETSSSFKNQWLWMIRNTMLRLLGKRWGGGMTKGRRLSINQIPILFNDRPEVWVQEQKMERQGYIEKSYLDRQWNKLQFIYVFFQLYITRYMEPLIRSHNRADDDTGSMVYDILYEFRLLIDRISYWNYFPWEVLLLTDTIDGILLAMNNVNNKIGMMRTAGLPVNYTGQNPDFLLLRQMAVAGQQNYFTFQILQLYYFNTGTAVTYRNYTTQSGLNAAKFDLTNICQQLRPQFITPGRGVPDFPMVVFENNKYPQNHLLTEQPVESTLLLPDDPLNFQSLLTQSVFQIIFSSNGISVRDLMNGLRRPDLSPIQLYGYFLWFLGHQDVSILALVAEGDVGQFSEILSPPSSEASYMSVDSGIPSGTPQDADADQDLSQPFSQPSQPIAPHDPTDKTPGTSRKEDSSSSKPSAPLSPAETRVINNILVRYGSKQGRIAAWLVNERKTKLMVEQSPIIQGGPTQNYWISLKSGLVYNNPEMKQRNLVDNVSELLPTGAQRSLFGGKRKKKTRRRKRRKRKKTRIKKKKKRKKKTRRRR